MIKYMNLRSYFFPALVLASMMSACVQPPDYSNIPEIEFIRFNQDSIKQGNSLNAPDTLEIIFSFTDGDGDLGSDDDSIDVFFTDSRDEFETPFKLPVIPNIGTENGISGEITVRVPNQPFNICCTYPDNSPPCVPNPQFEVDTFSYNIFLRDRAGNMSNRIQTSPVTIICN